jgi:predicted nucleic acid-binding protein
MRSTVAPWLSGNGSARVGRFRPGRGHERRFTRDEAIPEQLCARVPGPAVGIHGWPAPGPTVRHAPPYQLGVTMTRYVIGSDVAVVLAHDRTVIAEEHRLVAPTLLRSQVLSRLYQAVRQGELTKDEADHQLDYLRALRIRLLGDRVLQSLAWRIADQLGWPDTLNAEYVALTRLQADAFITLDANLARAVAGLVTVAPVDVLS